MATTTASTLTVDPREPAGSRAARRLRREGLVLGVVYGGGKDPVSFQVDARELRLALSHAGAVLDLSVGGTSSTPVVVKEVVRHPVTGETMHIDLLRVRLDKPIQATVVIELLESDSAPGVKEGGVLEHITREVTVEALPNDIPDSLTHDVSEMQIGETITLGDLVAPSKVTIIGDAETVIATLTPPRLQAEPETEIEEETEVVGEAQAAAEGEREPAGDAEGESGE